MSPKILIISPVPFYPQDAGNRTRIYSLLRALKNLDYDVHFAHIQETSGDSNAMQQALADQFYSIPYQTPTTRHKTFSKSLHKRIFRKAQSWACRASYYNFKVDDWYDNGVNNRLEDLAKSINPDVVIVEYVFFSKALECFDSNVLKIIDTHDMFSDRYKLYLKNKQQPRWYSTSKQQENWGLQRADVILAIQEKEARAFSERLKADQKVITVGHLVPQYQLPALAKSNSILYVASSNIINTNAINSFIEETLPKIKAKIEDVRLILAGSICDVVEDFDGCLKLGRVKDLKDAYSLASVVVNPICFGTGLKIKNIEALAYSKPLVTTSVGAEGMEDIANNAFRIANTSDEFVNEIVCILTDKQLSETLSGKAYEFVAIWNKRCLASLSTALAP